MFVFDLFKTFKKNKYKYPCCVIEMSIIKKKFLTISYIETKLIVLFVFIIKCLLF